MAKKCETSNKLNVNKPDTIASLRHQLYKATVELNGIHQLIDNTTNDQTLGAKARAWRVLHKKIK